MLDLRDTLKLNYYSISFGFLFMSALSQFLRSLDPNGDTNAS